MAGTLVFCTSYSSTERGWQERWRQWITYVVSSPLKFDQAWIVDDCSPCLPGWPDVEVLEADNLPAPSAQVSLHRFRKRLGRQTEGGPFPGWYRSFSYAIERGMELDFDRIIHIESDAFLISEKAFCLFNSFKAGWLGLWCPLHNWPESTLQVLARSCYPQAREFFSLGYSCLGSGPGRPIERLLPFTHVEKELTGDRYGEICNLVPIEADFVSQVRWGQERSYYWWLRADGTFCGELSMPSANEVKGAYRRPNNDTVHAGADYRSFLKFLDESLQPNSYLEIGTHQGDSAEQFSCQSICIDPNFVLKRDVVKTKPATFFFQMTSDNFFEKFNPNSLVGDIDLAFLDGLHHYEALTRDFLNVERHSHADTIVLLHDCLPLNSRMTSRVHAMGPLEEDERTRGFWTGDVWKVIPILKELRPALEMFYVDCPPTGLVLCRGLVSGKPPSEAAISAAIEKLSKLTVEGFGLPNLWSLCSMLDSRAIMSDPRLFGQFFRLHRSKNRGALVNV